MSTMDVNLNSAECIKNATYFGHTTYTNICNGNVNIVEWGSADWVLAILMTTFGVAVVLLTIFGVLSLIGMMIDDQG